MPSTGVWPVTTGDPIWVHDRHGTGLPYSKGLMAASIMATGLPPQRAYQLALAIEERLRDRGLDSIGSDELTTEAAMVLMAHESGETTDRYLAWRRAKRSPRPVIVLIGGATGVGKSTVATKLAARLDLPRVTSTDSVRQIMRSFLSPETTPEIHRSSFEGGEGSAGFLSQAQALSSGVIGLIERAVAERTDLIIEGVHLVPGLLDDQRFEDLRSRSVIVQVLMVLECPEIHRSHFLNRLDNEHGRSPHRYLDLFDRIRIIQDDLIAAARASGVQLVDATELDRAIQTLIDLVVAEVTAAGAVEAAG